MLPDGNTPYCLWTILDETKPESDQASKSNSLQEKQETEDYIKWHHKDRVIRIQNLGNSTGQPTWFLQQINLFNRFFLKRKGKHVDWKTHLQNMRCGFSLTLILRHQLERKRGQVDGAGLGGDCIFDHFRKSLLNFIRCDNKYWVLFE